MTPTRSLLPSVPHLLLAGLLAALVPAPSMAQKMPEMPTREGRRVGEVAFDFTLKDLDGKAHRLRDLRGTKVVHVVFWATWCMPCIEEVPHLTKVYDQYREQGLEIYGVVVPMNQTRDGVRAFVKKFGMEYPVLWDDGLSLMNKYRVSSIPQNFLIGRDGVIRYAGVELPEGYEDLIRKILAQETGPRTAAK